MNSRPSRPIAWLSALLLLSVALNCGLIGSIAGHLLWARDEPPAASAGGPLSFGERMRRLPPAEREKFQAAMAPYRAGIRAARAEIAAARGQFRQTLRREPYDPVAMLQAMTAVREKAALHQERVQEAAAKAFAVLSPQSREQLSRPYPEQ
jgi:uncharacterized membrane protein